MIRDLSPFYHLYKKKDACFDEISNDLLIKFIVTLIRHCFSLYLERSMAVKMDDAHTDEHTKLIENEAHHSVSTLGGDS